MQSEPRLPNTLVACKCCWGTEGCSDCRRRLFPLGLHARRSRCPQMQRLLKPNPYRQRRRHLTVLVADQNLQDGQLSARSTGRPLDALRTLRSSRPCSPCWATRTGRPLWTLRSRRARDTPVQRRLVVFTTVTSPYNSEIAMAVFDAGVNKACVASVSV